MRRRAIGGRLLDFPLRNLVILLSFFVLLKPSLLETVSGANLAMRVGAVLVLFVVGGMYLRSGTNVSAGIFVFLAFRLAFLFPTLIGGGDLANWAYGTVSQVALFGLLELELTSDEKRASECLKMLRFLLASYLVINCIMVLRGIGKPMAGSGGVVNEWYLLGMRTRVTDCFFPAVMVSMILDWIHRKRLGFATIIVIVSGVSQIILLGVVTAYAGIAAFLLILVLLWCSRRARFVLKVVNIVVLGLAANFLVVMLRVQKEFADILVGYLGKSITLTGRTEIWDRALEIVSRSPITGYGINGTVGAFVPYLGRLWQAHNQFIQLLYDGGIIAVVLFLALILICGRGIDRFRESEATFPMRATLFAFLLMMISEIYTYNMGLFFLVPFLMNEIGSVDSPYRDLVSKDTRSAVNSLSGSRKALEGVE